VNGFSACIYGHIPVKACISSCQIQRFGIESKHNRYKLRAKYGKVLYNQSVIGQMSNHTQGSLKW